MWLAPVRRCRSEELFGDEPFTFVGRHYMLTDFDSFPKPIQRLHPPIFVGAAGKRMLSIATREADIIGFQTVSTSSGKLSQHPREQCRASDVLRDAG